MMVVSISTFASVIWPTVVILNRLPRTVRVGHDADRRFGRAMAGQNFLGPGILPVASQALGVEQRDDKIGARRLLRVAARSFPRASASRSG